MRTYLYKCGNLPNRIVTYDNNIYWTFQKYVRMNKPPVLIPILSNKNLNVINGDVINGNDISTYDQVYSSNGEHKKIEYGNYDIINVRNNSFHQKNGY